jgi:hypothetical protein
MMSDVWKGDCVWFKNQKAPAWNLFFFQVSAIGRGQLLILVVESKERRRAGKEEAAYTLMSK